MATEVLMPRQGQSVESCLILEWKKKEGDQVKTGDILCEVETDKATFEVEAPADGVLIKITRPQGSDVPVLTPIAYIGKTGETAPAGDVPAPSTAPAGTKTPAASKGSTGAAPAAGDATAAPAALAAPAPRAPAPAASSGIPAGKTSPRARNLAEARGVALGGLTGSGPGGRIVERDVLAILGGRQPLSPAAVEAAITSHLSVPAAGSGPGGRVMLKDLTAGIPDSSPAVTPDAKPSLLPAAGIESAVTEIPVKGIRKLIAERMLASLRGHAQLTMNSSADARAILAFRKKLKESPEALGLGGITLGDFVLFAVARTIPLFPEMNAHWLGDRILRFERVHLGFAVDTPKGLLVPVIRNADRLSLKEISAEAKRLAGGCLEGGIAPDELTGGTFTITNLGALGIESFTPVLNSPQAAILGVCAITPKAVMEGEEVRFVPSIGLSLTIDHQAVDGAPGARFLKELSETLARFDIILAKG